MSMKIDIQTFTDFDDSVRFTFYESWFNKSIVIVKEERFTDEDWAVVNWLSVPKDIFGLLKGKGSTFTCSENFGCVGTAEVKFHAKTIENRLQLPIPVRKCLLERDCGEIPLYENQTGYFNDLESLEWFWDLPKESSEDDPGKKTPNSHCSKPFLEGMSGDGRGDVSDVCLSFSSSAN